MEAERGAFLVESLNTSESESLEESGQVEDDSHCIRKAREDPTELQTHETKNSEGRHLSGESLQYSFENFKEVALFRNAPTIQKYFFGCKW